MLDHTVHGRWSQRCRPYRGTWHVVTAITHLLIGLSHQKLEEQHTRRLFQLAPKALVATATDATLEQGLWLMVAG